MGIILQPFAWLLLFFYNLFNSYGIALILFAIVNAREKRIYLRRAALIFLRPCHNLICGGNI